MIKVFGDSNVGLVRTNNEDNWFAANLDDDLALLVVADGVGGHAFGEVASQITVDLFRSLFEAGKLAPAAEPKMRDMLLTMAGHKAHVDVSKVAVEQPDKSGMSCTLTAALCDATSVTLYQVGDSRLYLWSNGVLTQLSKDQTVAQGLVDDGRITPEQLKTHPDRGTLQQSIGLEAIDKPIEPVITTHEWSAGDVLISCTDGLSDMATDDDIASIMTTVEPDASAVKALIKQALSRGGRDNVTIAIAHNQ
jgi:serine/threonine protein phosphatase PrpC